MDGNETAGASPALFSGWRIVAVAFFSQALAIGFTMGTYTFFVRPLEQDFGVSRDQAMGGLSLMIVAMGVSLPFIGRALDTRSARAVMLIGALVNAACLLALSLATALWQLAVLCFGLGVGMAMMGPVASSTVVANWFEEKRGQALGIANMGAPAGPFFVAPLAAFGIESLGWRGTLVVYSVLLLVLAVPAIWLVIVNRPSDVGQLPDGRPTPAGGPGAHAHAGGGPEWTPRGILASGFFWNLAFTIGVVMAGPIVISGHLEPYGHSLGIEPASVSVLLMVMTVGTIAGTFGFGVLADRFDLRRLLWIAIAVQAGCWAGLLTAPSTLELGLLLTAFAVCAGATMPIYGSIIARHFGPTAFGAVMGTAGLVMLPIHALAPLVAGALYEASGDYASMIQAVIATLAVAAVTLAFLRPTPLVPATQPAVGS